MMSVCIHSSIEGSVARTAEMSISQPSCLQRAPSLLLPSRPSLSRFRAASSRSRHASRHVCRRPVHTQGMSRDDVPPAEMTYESALELLGVKEGASFDDILQAKKRRLESIGENPELALRVEAAYDILLMQSLSRRRAGQVVDYSVKYADVRNVAAKQASSKPGWVKGLGKATSLTVAKPSNQEAATKAAVFGALAAWTYVGGLSNPTSYSQYGANAGGDVPGLQLALAIGASVYFLRKDNVGLGRAAALSFAALIAGGLFGGFLDTWLRVDIFPLLGVSSPAVLIGEFSTVFLALACIFLR